jgi:hypothetical protein
MEVIGTCKMRVPDMRMDEKGAQMCSDEGTRSQTKLRTIFNVAFGGNTSDFDHR